LSACAGRVNVEELKQGEEMHEAYKKQDRELIDLKQTYGQDAI
jgi:hypothetical protein